MRALSAVLSTGNFRVRAKRNLIEAIVLQARRTIRLPIMRYNRTFLGKIELLLRPFERPITSFIGLNVNGLCTLTIARLSIITIFVLASTFRRIKANIIRNVFRGARTIVITMVSLRRVLVHSNRNLRATFYQVFIRTIKVSSTSLYVRRITRMDKVRAYECPALARIRIRILGNCQFKGTYLRNFRQLPRSYVIKVFLRPFFCALHFLCSVTDGRTINCLMTICRQVMVSTPFGHFHRFLFQRVQWFDRVQRISATRLIRQNNRHFL